MSELENAVYLANKLLDEPNADPDDDLRVLSRQLLRQVELVTALKVELAFRVNRKRVGNNG